jgi:hypothetical protein
MVESGNQLGLSKRIAEIQAELDKLPKENNPDVAPENADIPAVTEETENVAETPEPVIASENISQPSRAMTSYADLIKKYPHLDREFGDLERTSHSSVTNEFRKPITLPDTNVAQPAKPITETIAEPAPQTKQVATPAEPEPEPAVASVQTAPTNPEEGFRMARIVSDRIYSDNDPPEPHTGYPDPVVLPEVEPTPEPEPQINVDEPVDNETQSTQKYQELLKNTIQTLKIKFPEFKSRVITIMAKVFVKRKIKSRKGGLIFDNNFWSTDEKRRKYYNLPPEGEIKYNFPKFPKIKKVFDLLRKSAKVKLSKLKKNQEQTDESTTDNLPPIERQPQPLPQEQLQP